MGFYHVVVPQNLLDAHVEKWEERATEPIFGAVVLKTDFQMMLPPKNHTLIIQNVRRTTCVSDGSKP